MLKIKEEYLDSYIHCPATGEKVMCRFIDRVLYVFYAVYYPDIFKKENEDDLSNNGN